MSGGSLQDPVQGAQGDPVELGQVASEHPELVPFGSAVPADDGGRTLDGVTPASPPGFWPTPAATTCASVPPADGPSAPGTNDAMGLMHVGPPGTCCHHDEMSVLRLVPWRRDHWLRQVEALDPDADTEQIYRITAYHEFPWDIEKALSFALFRTYAVPSIGALLAGTGEFTWQTQKRYEDTALILEAALEHGLASGPGRDAVRRMNQMHHAYAISNDDMRYVLSTFVVVPKRWLDAYGWRSLSSNELLASVRYYQALGARMDIRGLPVDYDGFVQLLDDYERVHFAYDDAARGVADATLALLATIPPIDRLPAWVAHLASRSLMDEPLLDAFRLRRPPGVVCALVRSVLRARGFALRWFPPRLAPRFVRDSTALRLYPHGHEVALLGTFPGRNRMPSGVPDPG